MDTLGFYDVENAADLTALDLATVAPASSDDTLLQVSNGSTFQAQNVTVAVIGNDYIQLLLSTDGDTYTATITVGDIPPGGLSATFWLRRVTPSYLPDGPCAAQLSATPDSWTDPVDTSTSDNIPITTGN